MRVCGYLWVVRVCGRVVKKCGGGDGGGGRGVRREMSVGNVLYKYKRH